MVWGTTYVVTTELLPQGHPLFAGLLRALPAGVIALALTRTLPRGAWWWKAAVLGVLSIGLFLPLLFVAAERLPGGVAATSTAAQPLVVALLAVPVLRVRLTAWRLLWGVAGVVGIGLVVIGPNAALDAVGIAAGLGGAATMALGMTLTKRWGRPAGVGPTAFAGWQLTAGGLFLVPVTFLVEGSPPAIDAPAALGYLWLGLVGGLITYALWFQGITTLPVTSVAVLGLLSPLVAAVLGALLLGQTLGPVQLLGFGLALAAILAGQLPPPARSHAPSGRTSPMRIAVVGAAGMVGSRVIDEAARRGHDLVAIYRTGRPAALPPGVTAVAGDANAPGRMSGLFAGTDAVVAATRPAPGREHTVAATTKALLDAAATARTRVLVVGGAAPLRLPGDPGRRVLDSPEYVPEAFRAIAAASAAQLDTCRAHPADWIYLSPPAVLEPGPRTARYRRGTTTLVTGTDGTSRISAEDLAVAILDELETPHRDTHFTVGY
ncbi:EamA family transporter [Streptomyces specialis]|uniref:EamA family transporter n=1 Tax=Streptomyces specialis TaxID=498367 RepID=UPI00389AF7F4